MKTDGEEPTRGGQRFLKFLQANWPAFYIPLMVLAISREIVPALLVTVFIAAVLTAKAREERKK